MKKHFLILPMVFLMCLTFGCRGGEEVAEAVSEVMTDMAMLKDMSDKFDAANNAGDAEAIVALNYAEGAVRMPPNEPMMVGKTAILEWFKASFEQNDVQVDNVALEAKVSGDLAYKRGVYTIDFTPKAGGDVTHGTGHWVAVYERQADGGWKVICDIWVADDSVSAPPTGAFQGGVMSGSESADAETDIAAIRKALDDWYAAYNAGDYEKLASYYVEDAVSISDDEPPSLSGRDEILAAFKQEMELYDMHVDEGLVEDVRVSGDLGMARGADSGTATAKDGSDPLKFNTKWVALYVRQDDGSWLCICEIGNSNLPRSD